MRHRRESNIVGIDHRHDGVQRRVHLDLRREPACIIVLELASGAIIVDQRGAASSRLNRERIASARPRASQRSPRH
jgi:hypothetical protein